MAISLVVFRCSSDVLSDLSLIHKNLEVVFLPIIQSPLLIVCHWYSFSSILACVKRYKKRDTVFGFERRPHSSIFLYNFTRHSITKPRVNKNLFIYDSLLDENIFAYTLWQTTYINRFDCMYVYSSTGDDT